MFMYAIYIMSLIIFSHLSITLFESEFKNQNRFGRLPACIEHDFCFTVIKKLYKYEIT